MNTRKLLSGVAAAILASAAAGQAGAVTITDLTGQFTVGLGANGELYDSGAGIGFLRNADGYDPISLGTPRDSWGLNADYADGAFFGSTISSLIVADANGATATTTTSDGLAVQQVYSFVGANILRISTTVTNTTGDILRSRFQRNVDWDPPATFTNRTFGPIGANSKVIDSSFFGFESPLGSDSYFAPCTLGCDDAADNGAGIRVFLGLGAGQTARFDYFYGINLDGDAAGDLIGQTLGAGANYVIAGESTDGGSQSMTLGVGAVTVPEPATWAMMLMGFLGLGSMVRRRKAALA